MSQWALNEAKAAQDHQSNETPMIHLSGLRRLGLLFGTATFITLWLVNGSVTAEVLFQSPQSPPTQPQAPVEPAEPPPAEQPTQDLPVPEQPAVEQPPAAEEQPVLQQEPPPAQSPPAQPTPEQAATDPAVPPTPTAGQETEQSAPEASASESDQPATVPADEFAFDEAGQEESNLILDRAEFIDTIAVSGAYIWLCCGFILLLLVPMFMLVVYIRGRSKIVANDEF